MNYIKIIFVFTLLFLIGCSSTNRYYKYIAEKSTLYDLDPSFSFYMLFQLEDDSLNIEYLLPFTEINYGNNFTYKSPKDIWKSIHSSSGKLFIDSNDCFCDINDYKVIQTEFGDSISKLTIDDVLSSYFENNIRLKTEKLDIQKQKSIIYYLVKRKKYVSFYNPGNNKTLYSKNIFYGKVVRNNKWKAISIIETKLGRNI